MKTVAILGSTGSIGKNTLKVISRLADKFKVVGLTAGSNGAAFAEQIKQFRPQIAAIMDETKVPALRSKLNLSRSRVKGRTRLLAGREGVEEVASCGADIVVVAISGNAALLPVLCALKKTKRLALANKECLVMAGDIIMRQARVRGVEIIPVDSEHSAIFQCLKEERNGSLEKIYLTASGGPLKDLAKHKFKFVRPESALKHPRWKMGKKISIDSATMINKGFEVIEASYLFGMPAEKIDVVVHPEALVHSLVQFVDGSILAQLGETDMRLPIQFALTYPRRFPSRLSKLNFSSIRSLTFSSPDLAKFPCLKLAFQAAKQKGLAGSVLSAADEECVRAYLQGRIKFNDIPRIIGKVLSRLKNKSHPSLEDILGADNWAREQVQRIMTVNKVNYRMTN